jgi:hypothetical protein
MSGEERGNLGSSSVIMHRGRAGHYRYWISNKVVLQLHFDCSDPSPTISPPFSALVLESREKRKL